MIKVSMTCTECGTKCEDVNTLDEETVWTDDNEEHHQMYCPRCGAKFEVRQPSIGLCGYEYYSN